MSPKRPRGAGHGSCRLSGAASRSAERWGGYSGVFIDPGRPWEVARIPGWVLARRQRAAAVSGRMTARPLAGRCAACWHGRLAARGRRPLPCPRRLVVVYGCVA
jgi:hypothetical protein